MGGIETGIVPKVNVRANGRLVPEVEGQLDALWESGTPEQIMQFAEQHGLGLDPEAVTSFIAERDAGRPVSTKTVYGKQLEQEAQAFQDRPQPEPTNLEREAAEFQGTRDPTPEDLFPVDKTPEQEAHVNFVVDEVNKIAKDWKNSPESWSFGASVRA